LPGGAVLARAYGTGPFAALMPGGAALARAYDTGPFVALMPGLRGPGKPRRPGKAKPPPGDARKL